MADVKTLTDRELEALFAEKVAGWTWDDDARSWLDDDLYFMKALPDPVYVSYVLPAVERLAKQKGWKIEWRYMPSAGEVAHEVRVREITHAQTGPRGVAFEVSLARALVLASLRAVGENV